MATKKPNIVIDHTPAKYIKISWNGTDNIEYIMKSQIIKICGQYQDVSGADQPYGNGNYPYPHITKIFIYLVGKESNEIVFDLMDVSSGIVGFGTNTQAALDVATLELANSI